MTSMSAELSNESGSTRLASAAQESSEQAELRQFVTFVVADEVFAVDMAPVQEIIRVPSVVRVPLAPASLEGLANLRGRVLPIISLRRLFTVADRAQDDASRAVVIDLGQPLGFIVDRVTSVISVEPHQIEDVTDIKQTVNSELLIGVLKNVAGYSMVMLLDFARLIAHEFAAIQQCSQRQDMSLTAVDTPTEDDDVSDEWQLVSFSVDGEEYAIDITHVQEIVQVPAQIVNVPNTASHVLGLMTLRERLLPLVSLRTLFHLPPAPITEQCRIVVVALAGAQHSAAVGVVTDTVSEVLRVPRQLVDAMPALLLQQQQRQDISQICRLDGGKRLVSIISVAEMFQQSAVMQAMSVAAHEEGAMQHSERTSGEHDDELTDDDWQIVVFRLADGEFGVPIDAVQEIVRIPEQLTHVPKAPSFVEGVINLRGVVLPVIDQRARLGLPSTARNERQRIMVFTLRGVRVGFIVDAVTEVLKVPQRFIETAPQLSAAQRRLLGQVANLPQHDRMIQLLAPEQLLDDEEEMAMASMQ